jgi:hypothetical protein
MTYPVASIQELQGSGFLSPEDTPVCIEAILDPYTLHTSIHQRPSPLIRFLMDPNVEEAAKCSVQDCGLAHEASVHPYPRQHDPALRAA